MKRVLTPSLFITYPPSPFLFKRSFSVLFTFPNIGQNKSRWRLMLTATLLHIKNKSQFTELQLRWGMRNRLSYSDKIIECRFAGESRLRNSKSEQTISLRETT